MQYQPQLARCRDRARSSAKFRVHEKGVLGTDMGKRVAEPNVEQPQNLASDRLVDIDRTKGFAISLVVWGHIASFAPAGSPLWFYISVNAIYSFHMPLFMYLSGFVFFYKGLHERFLNSPAKQAINRFDRLMVPFLFFGIVVVFGKYLVGQKVALPGPVSSISDGLWRVVVDAPDNPSSSIWYLFVIFVYSILTPLLWKVGRRRFLLLFGLAILGWVINVPQEFYAARVAKYFIFFVIGGFTASRAGVLLSIFEKYSLAFLIIFLILCFQFFTHPAALLICGISSLPAFHGLFRKNFLEGDNVLYFLGRNSMAIYLMNTIFIGIFGIVFVALGLRSLALFSVLFAVGITGPILVRVAINKFGALRPIARYLS